MAGQQRVEIKFEKGEATVPAVIAALASAPDDAEVRVMNYMNGQIHKLIWVTTP